MAQQFEEVGDMSLAKEYGQVYGLVMDLFDRIVALLGEEVMGQREYAEILDAGFAEIKVGLDPRGRGPDSGRRYHANPSFQYKSVVFCRSQ